MLLQCDPIQDRLQVYERGGKEHDPLKIYQKTKDKVKHIGY